MFLIFIAGASASGKSSIARALLQDLLQEGRTAQILSLDNYFHERPAGDTDPKAYRLNTNFDDPEMLDFNLLKGHLQALSQGNPIAQPIFQFESNRRIGEQTIVPSEFIIVEGMFAQYFFNSCFNHHQSSLSIFVSVDSYLGLLERRKARDIRERDRSPEIVIRQERRDGGPCFFKFTALHAAHSDLHIHNNHASDQNYTDILNEIKTAIKEKSHCLHCG
ncbi:MAG TPA: hypothetical protein DDY37_07430 [Legionella sp.]|nr:hypothetical protein [Legionella sp.]